MRVLKKGLNGRVLKTLRPPYPATGVRVAQQPQQRGAAMSNAAAPAAAAPPPPAIVAYVTVPDKETGACCVSFVFVGVATASEGRDSRSPFENNQNKGERIARALLDARLIACANIIPGWKGEVHSDAELMMVRFLFLFFNACRQPFGVQERTQHTGEPPPPHTNNKQKGAQDARVAARGADGGRQGGAPVRRARGDRGGRGRREQQLFGLGRRQHAAAFFFGRGRRLK